MLDVLPPLGAETAADIIGDHAHAALRNLEHVLGQHIAYAMGILAVGVERVALLAWVVVPERPTRLHELGMHARDDVTAPQDMIGCGEGGVGLGLLTEL